MTETRWQPPVPLIIACGCAIALLAFGPRSAMGFFQEPILQDKGWGSTTFGLAIAIQNLAWGLGQPIFGALADRFGAYKSLAAGGIIYAVGLYLMGTADAPIWLHIGGGVMVGLGVAAGSFGIILSVFARNVEPEKRSFVFGMGTAAGSAGMFLFSPLSAALIENFGWSNGLVYMSIMMLIIPVLAIPLYGSAKDARMTQDAIEQTIGEALSEAMRHKSYLLLITGFFVCGFQVAFITAHFPKYIADIGMAPIYAVWAIALIGLFNIFGSLASGVIGQKYSKPYFLALLYVGRSIAVTLFLLLPQTPTSVIIFSIVMGLLWLSTVAPTNALVAIMFGTRHLGMLGGIVFFSHQIGSFLGVYYGGYLRDLTGSYDTVWWLGVALGLFAAAVHWPIREAPVDRTAQGTATA
ncbi:MFS transporter [Pseudahrensia aquimaris]|uniref:MFS transporter n=1 Tax=Pseudahrensia aquimaris TaxID=744461 RepID=A0ABW3FH89_9HYPH